MTPADVVATIESTFQAFPASPIPAARGGDHYRDANAHPRGIALSHALETLRRPRVIETFGFTEADVALAVRRVPGTPPFDMLVEAHKLQHGWQVTGAWRFYQLDDTARPRDLFAKLVATYGVEVVFGGFAPAMFIGHLTLPSFAGEPSTLASFPTHQPGQVLDAPFAFRQNRSGDVTLSWAYALDRATYQRGATAQAL